MPPHIRSAEDALARAEANGYKRGQFREEDAKIGHKSYVTKTLKNHNWILRRYLLYWQGHHEREHAVCGELSPSETEIRERYLSKDVKAPVLVTLKDFTRFFIALSRGLIKDVPTADSINSTLEFFFAGFANTTGTVIPEEDRLEMYSWVRKTLTAEGVVVNIRRPKHNMTKVDIGRILKTSWIKDDLSSVHVINHLQFNLVVILYMSTGARLGAFFAGAFRYQDLDLVLQRTGPNGRQWRMIYQIKQRWVKNNRDPENIYFGSASKEQEILAYNGAWFIYLLAILDNALFGFKSIDAIREQEIPEGEDEVRLRWNDNMLQRPILRKCTKANGRIEKPMSKQAFVTMFGDALLAAGYQYRRTIHSIRRGLGKEVKKRYTSVELAQHLIQRDPKEYAQSYLANCSSVEGQDAFLQKEKTDHRHIEYFQSLEPFRERGMPTQLPAGIEANLKHDPDYIKICQATEAGEETKSKLAQFRRKWRNDQLKAYQETWIRERRDWKILTRGKERPDDPANTDIVHSLWRLYPQRRRLAEAMASAEPLPPDVVWSVMRDAHDLCSKDLSVIYLPGLDPLDGSCPVTCCRLNMDSLPKSRRNSHILACIRREIASRAERLVSSVRYCYECFQWTTGEEWEDHCQSHISELDTKRCGTITYSHTLVRPACCPFCLGDQDLLPVSARMQTWTRDGQLWEHVEGHVKTHCWPSMCPHPLCNVQVADSQELRYHFVDVHGLSRSWPGKQIPDIPGSESKSTEPQDPSTNTPLRKLKRKASNNGDGLKWMPFEQPNPDSFAASSPKKTRRSSLTVAPLALLHDDGVFENDLTQQSLRDTSPMCAFDVQDTMTDDVADFALTSVASCLQANDDSISDADTLFQFPTRASSLRCDEEFLKKPSESEWSLADNETLSTTVDDDALFSAFLRSPSPFSTSDDEVVRETCQTTETGSQPLNQDESRWSQTAEEPVKPTAIRIRLRVNPPKLQGNSADSRPSERKSRSTASRKSKIKLRIHPPKAKPPAKHYAAHSTASQLSKRRVRKS